MALIELVQKHATARASVNGTSDTVVNDSARTRVNDTPLS